MKDLNEIFKKIRNINPDPDYVRKSRFLILESKPLKATGFWSFVFHNLQFGSVVAVTAALVLLILGGFSVLNFLSPFRLTSLDTISLRAEADAIDLQVEIADLSYDETVRTVIPSAGTISKVSQTLVAPEETAAAANETTTPEIAAAPEATSSSSTAAEAPSEDIASFDASADQKMAAALEEQSASSTENGTSTVTTDELLEELSK